MNNYSSNLSGMIVVEDRWFKDKGLLASISILVMLILFEVIFYNVIHGFDMSVYEIVCCSVDYIIVKAITITAGVPATLLYLTILYLLEVKRLKSKPRYTVYVLSSLIIAMTLEFFLKALLQFPRPGSEHIRRGVVEGFLHFDDYSFPSGHTARAATIAACFSRDSSVTNIVLWVWVLLVGFSRLVLGVHWFSDIVAGIVLGFFSSRLAIIFNSKLIK